MPSPQLLALPLVAAFTLSPSSAEARLRTYRVIPEVTLGAGYALAWGLKNTPLDFEALEADPKKAEAFLDGNAGKLVNYIVDLESDTVVAVAREPAFYATLGDAFLHHNHETFDARSLPVSLSSAGQDLNVSAVLLESGSKWDNGLDTLLLFQRTGHRARQIASDPGIEERIEAAIEEKLPPNQKTALGLARKSNAAVALRLSVADQSWGIFQYSVTYYEPKSEEPGLELRGKFRLRLNDKTTGVEVVDADDVSFGPEKEN